MKRSWVARSLNTHLNIPAKRAKLLPLLDDGMEKAYTEHKLTPRHAKNCHAKTKDKCYRTGEGASITFPDQWNVNYEGSTK